MGCLFCFKAPSWSKIPRRVVRILHVICIPCLFVGISLLVNLGGDVREEARIGLFVTCLMPTVMALIAPPIARPIERFLMSMEAKWTAFHMERERKFSESCCIAHIRQIYLSLDEEEQRDHLPTILKVLATMPCQPSNENVTHIWGSMAVCAARVGVVDEVDCQDIGHLMGPEAMRQLPPLKMLEYIRVEPPPLGMAPKDVFTRPMRSADLDHWMAYKQTTYNQQQIH